MSMIKRVQDLGVTMAWCPSKEHKSLIAAASKEGAGGGFDDVGGCLEIYELDLSSETESMVKRGSAKTSLKFECLAWAQLNSQSHPTGIIAGGMTDGSLSIWDPHILINGGSDQIAGVQGKHKANVNALAFNPASNMNHILASGSADNTVYLFDLNNPTGGEIAHYAPAEGDITGHQAPVRAIAWNNEVENCHILASAASDGVVSVWDLRAKRPWCHLKDPKRQPCSAISWNPSTGSGNVYLMTASDDDTKPVMRLWDLRKSTTVPMFELGNNTAAQGDIPGHSLGIVSLDWCPYDEAIVVSSGKDKRTLFWDLYSCQVVDELDTIAGSTPAAPTTAPTDNSGGFGSSPFGQQASTGFGSQSSGFGGGAPRGFGAQAAINTGGGGSSTDSGVREIIWSPSLPGVLACSTLGREMQIHGITAFSGNPQRAPKWLKRPGSVSFGFGGKLVSCSEKGQNKVIFSSVTSEPALVQSASAFSDAMATNDFHNYCGYKVCFASAIIDLLIMFFFY